MTTLSTTQPRRTLRVLTLATLTLLAATAGLPARAQQAASAPAPAASGPTVRAETAKPLQEAQEALKTGKHQEALDKLVAVEAVPGLTPYERYVVARFRLAAASGKGDQALALATLQGVIDSEFLPEGERRSLNEALIRLAVQTKQYAVAVKRYQAAGGSNAELRELYPRLLAETGDQAGAAREFAAQVQAEEAAGRLPGETLLSRLAVTQNALKDDAGYLDTLGKLAGTTGKPDYWNELLARTNQRPGFADERLRLDLYRLKQAVGLALPAGELGDMAYRASQAGLPAEAQKLLDDGFNAGVLGKDANAAADRKLREAVTKAAANDRASLNDAETAARNAKDGNVPFALGMALSGAGQHDKALAVMTVGQAKGGLKQPDDALLHLGVVQWRAGKVPEALASFAQVKGGDGTADLARLWTLYLKSPARK